MPLVVKDRVLETSTTTGTGTLTLAGASTGYQTFSSAIGNGNTTYYAISLNGEWEVGIGTVGAGTLSRDTVLESSNAGSLVNFSAGAKQVFCTYPAEKSVDIDTAQTLTNKTISVDNNTVSGIAASSFVLSNSSGNIDGSASQKAIPSGVVVGTTDTQTLSNKSFASSLTINGSTSGAITLQATPIAGNNTLTLPASTGTIVVTNGAQTIEFADGSASAPSITNSGDTNTGMFFPAADTIAFAEGGTEVMRIDSSGNVGIGTNSPTAGYRLSLTGGAGLNIQNTGASDNSVVKYSNSSKNWYVGLRGDTSNVWAVSDDSAFRMIVDTNGNLQFNSGYGSVATAYGCRAWVNFNGTGTVAIRASGNVSSITDNGVGIYTINFTNAMPDANYAVCSSGRYQTAGGSDDAPIVGVTGSNFSTPTTSAVQIGVTTDTASGVDPNAVYVSVFR